MTIRTVSRDAFGELAADESLEVKNTVTAEVRLATAVAAGHASASLTFQKKPLQVTLRKSFAAGTLVAGRSTTVTLTATNGVMPVSSLEVSEPAAGHDDLAAQGLIFGGFVLDPAAEQQLTWPSGAERAEVTYRYAGGESQAVTTDEVDTLPAPDADRRLIGFTVRFTAPDDGIDSRAKAILPFTVTAEPVTQEAGVTVANTARAEVVSSTPDTAADTVTTEETLLPLRVRTAVTKSLSRPTIWASPGTTDTVSLTAKVADDSTVGSSHLHLTDADATFWDHFDLRRIHSTDIPANASLTVTSWDGSGWQPLAGPVAGPVSDWSFTPSAEQRAQLAGLRFSFTSKTDDSLLPAGFTVAPRFDVALRRTLRSDPTVSTTAIAGPTPVPNQASAEVANPDAIEPLVTDTATATVSLKPTGSGGGGDGSLWLANKRWLDPIGGEQVDAANISALTDGVRTAVLAWGTDGLSLSRLELVDDPGYATPAASFYDAFDLVRIRPITPATDPQIAQDRVSGVALYSAAARDWVDVTPRACPTESACDGGFPGYTLSDAERRDTLAVRLAFAPGTASETGVIALSDSAERQVRLDYQLRRTLRSDGSYVLGSSHGQTYNSGTAGTVVNRAKATATLTEADDNGNTDVWTADSASIAILDQPLNVSVTKTLDQTQLGLPQRETTALTDYPLVSSTLVASNDTASPVPQLTLTDPSPKVAGLGAYERLNLHQIQLPELPEELTGSDVTVHLTRADGSSSDHGYAAAQELTPAELVDVVAVTISYGNLDSLLDPAKPLIAPGGTAKAVLTYQLRSEVRGQPGALVAEGDEVTNTALAEVHSPGGIGCAGDPTEGCDQRVATAADSLRIVQPTYTVTAGRTIVPSVRYEDQPGGYAVTLTGQPDGTARTKLLTLTDASPTFWNAFDLASIATVSLPTPMNELRLSVLTGVDYTLDGTSLAYRCAGAEDLARCWHPGEWQAPDADGRIALALPSGISVDQVRGVRAEARRAVDGQPVQWERPADPKLAVQLNVNRRAYLVHGVGGAADTPVPTTRYGQPTAPGEPAPGVTTGRLVVAGEAAWMRNAAPYTATATADATTTLRYRVNQIKVEKTPGQGSGSQPPRYDLDATIPYQVKITNTGSWQLTGLRISDRIDVLGGSSPLVAADGSTAFGVLLNGATAPGFTTALDPVTGQLTIGVPDGFVLAPGAVLQVNANLRFRDQLEAGTAVTNTVTVTSDRPFEKCDYTRDARAQTALTGQLSDCAASTTVVAAASTPMSVSTSVKGDGAGLAGAEAGSEHYDDLGVIAVGATDAGACAEPGPDGFYAYPCTPITRPGGRETWQLTVANNGNVAANVISAVDVLPAVGDTGVVVGTSRKSKFSPTFLGNVRLALPDSAASHRLRSYYATGVFGPSCNKADILNDTKPAGQDGCGIVWHEFTDATDPELLADAKALKFLLTFDDPGQGLEPGQKLSLRFDTRTPAHADLADSTTVEPVAWNSAAVESRTADSETFPARASLVTEPRKVGAALASGQLDLTKRVVTPDGATWTSLLPEHYDVTVTCTSQGAPVPLHGSTAAIDPSRFSLDAEGSVLHYNGTGGVNLPLGAECAVLEDATQGADITYSAAAVTAGRSYAGVANVAHGYTGAAPGELTVTNTYRAGGFTVAKTVTGPAATDATGAPVRFKDFAFTAGCTFAGTELIPAAERTFGLRHGGSKQFSGLPAGAECSVTETYPAGAATTSMAVSQGGRPRSATARARTSSSWPGTPRRRSSPPPTPTRSGRW